MTSTLDPTKIGQPKRGESRRHQRTLTGELDRPPSNLLHADNDVGYLPEKDAEGKEKWPRGDEAAWKSGIRSIDTGPFVANVFTHRLPHCATQMCRRSQSPS